MSLGEVRKGMAQERQTGYAAPTTACPTPARTSEVSEQMSELASSITQLCDVTDRLIGRLFPVLRQGSNPMPKEEMVRCGLCDLADQLRNRSDTVNSMTHLMRDALDRLEI